MNNFIVGQVTPTMLTHIGFGTFVFFGVSIGIRCPDHYLCSMLIQAFSLFGGFFVWFFVSGSLPSLKKHWTTHGMGFD